VRRRLLLLALVVLGSSLVTAVAWTVACRQPSAAGVTRENFLRLREGVSEEEAAAVLGPPAMRVGNDLDALLEWRGDGCYVRLQFRFVMRHTDWSSPRPEAVSGYYQDALGPFLSLGEQPQSFIDRLRYWLPW
jgi:hypothetical protein